MSWLSQNHRLLDGNGSTENSLVLQALLGVHSGPVAQPDPEDREQHTVTLHIHHKNLRESQAIREPRINRAVELPAFHHFQGHLVFLGHPPCPVNVSDGTVSLQKRTNS